MNFKQLILLSVLGLMQFSFFHEGPLNSKAKTAALTSSGFDEANPLCQNVVGVMNPATAFNEDYIYDETIYRLGSILWRR
jgi:hypothetical protein